MPQSNNDEQDSLLDSMLGDFLDESDAYLQSLNENLLKLDQWVNGETESDGPDQDLSILQEMFRAAHSLKGLSAMLGLSQINELTHKVENVFDAARNRELPITANTVDLVFRSVDLLSEMVECLKTDGHDNVNCEEVVGSIRELLQHAGVEKKRTSQADADKSFQECLTASASVANPGEAMPSDTNDSQSTVSSANEITPELMAEISCSLPRFDGVEDDVDFSSKYFAMFIDETQISIESLTDLLINAAEEHSAENLVEQLLITSHKIKGSAASIGLNRCAKFAHYVEDLLQEMRSNKKEVTPELADSLLECVDVIRAYVETLKAGDSDQPDFESSAKQLYAVRAQIQGATPEPSEMTNPSSSESTPTAVDVRVSPLESTDNDPMTVLQSHRTRIEQRAPVDGIGFVGIILFQPNLPLSELKARLAFEKLSQHGKLFYCSPSPDEMECAESVETVVFGIETESELTVIQNQLIIDGVAELIVEPFTSASTPIEIVDRQEPQEPKEPQPMVEVVKDATPKRPQPTSNTAQKQTSKPAETVRVDIDRLDQLMNLAGQLVINKARFSQISEGLKHVATGIRRGRNFDSLRSSLDRLQVEATDQNDGKNQSPEFDSLRSTASRIQAEMEAFQAEFSKLDHVRNSVNEMLDAVHQLERISHGIQKCVMDTRMVPIGPLFGRFKRVIRDITRSNKKEIELEIGGEKTELDKRMIDELGDPLIHMVRNSADHGIESPEAREAAGKPRRGTVSLDAFHRGNSIVIRVSDDGKGLDTEMIRKKAISKGIVSETETEKMTPHQIYQLIWEPGFSTAETITEVSGRGMGMDIVRSKIEDLNGTIELDSRPGHGTTITIKLPLTLAILPSLLAEIEGDVFALPVESVIEIVQVQDEDFATAYGKRTARVRGRIVSVVNLDELFSWSVPPRKDASSGDSPHKGNLLVIIGNEGNEVGLVVNSLLGEEDIVIKSLAENYRNVDGIAGASILGDGRVSLILDARALLELSSGRALITSDM